MKECITLLITRILEAENLTEAEKVSLLTELSKPAMQPTKEK